MASEAEGGQRVSVGSTNSPGLSHQLQLGSCCSPSPSTGGSRDSRGLLPTSTGICPALGSSWHLGFPLHNTQCPWPPPALTRTGRSPVSPTSSKPKWCRGAEPEPLTSSRAGRARQPEEMCRGRHCGGLASLLLLLVVLLLLGESLLGSLGAAVAAGLGVKPRAGVGRVAAWQGAVGDGVLRALGAEIGAEWLLSCLLLLCRAKPGSSHRNPAGCGQWYRGAVRAPARLLQNQQLPSLPIVNSVEVWEQLTSDRHLHGAELLPGCLGNSQEMLCNMLPSCHTPGPCCGLPRERIPAAVGPAAQ